MRDRKRILIWLLAGSFCLPVGGTGILPIRIVQAETQSIITNDVITKGSWKYKYDGTEDNVTVTIVEYTGTTDEVIIPDTMDDYPVTAIEGTAFKNSDIKKITIPKSILDIGDEAFFGCKKLESVEVASTGQGITTDPANEYMIGKNAFFGCSVLKSVELPEGITRIGPAAFYGNESLSTITIPNSVKLIERSAFYECGQLSSVKLPSELTSIGSSAFSKCAALTDIVIPNGVEELNFGAFEYCVNLETAVIPASVEVIKFDTFSDCNNLTIYAEPDSIAMYFADDTNRLIKGGIPVKSATTAVLEDETGWLYMEHDNWVEIVGYTEDAADVVIPDMLNGKPVTSIAGRIFKEKGVTSLVLPDSVTSIGTDIFNSCKSLKNVTLSANLESIGDSAFRYCEELEAVSFPSKVSYVGNYAFEDCTKLKSAVFEKREVEELQIGYNAFKKCDLQKMVLPDGVKDVLESTFEENSNMSSITLPEGIEHIGSYAFSHCSALKTIKIPDSVTYIWDDAFAFTGLEEVEIPEKVTDIEHYAFAYCDSLTKIKLPGTVERIGSHVFADCEKLTIYTNKDSVAEAYAKENKIPVILIDASGQPIEPVDPDASTTEKETEKETKKETKKETEKETEKATESSEKEVIIPTVDRVKKFKATAKKKSFVLTWKKVSGASGYQIQVSTKKNFKGAKIKSVKKSKTKYNVSKLKSKKKYYLRIRAYKTYKDAAGKTQKSVGKWVVINKKTK